MPFIRIDDIDAGMRNITIEGKIINMNPWMLVIEDESGQTFVRYRQRNLKAPVVIGDSVKVKNARAVEWSGVLQLKLDANGEVSVIGRVIAEN